MSQQITRLRIWLLTVLLAIEIALAISLRNSGWFETGNAVRSVLLGIAMALPFVMTAVLLYRMRFSLRRGQFSLRALMALMFVVASFLTLIKLLEKPVGPNLGPLPISKSTKFEIYTVSATSTSNGVSYTDPNEGSPLFVTSPPIISNSDVVTIELTPESENRANLSFVLNVNGGNKLLKATTASAGSRVVVIVDDVVLATPKVVSPIGHQFQLSGGRIYYDVFRELTETNPTKD